jgi:tRNA nucleotidyltransferase/poly(A) polymerase
MLKSYRDELKLKTVLRVAGGWVRDKVLNIILIIGSWELIKRYRYCIR